VPDFGTTSVRSGVVLVISVKSEAD